VKSAIDTWSKKKDSGPVCGATCELQAVKVFLVVTEHILVHSVP
jgi:hypothetical protein